jgi:transcriptional regulator with XRE-family HTH domain
MSNMATKSNEMTPGEYLRELRTEKGLSLKDLANALNVDFTLISKIELGERSLSMDLIPALAKALKTDFKALQVDLLSMKLANEFGEEEYAQEALKKALRNIG